MPESQLDHVPLPAHRTQRADFPHSALVRDPAFAHAKLRFRTFRRSKPQFCHSLQAGNRCAPSLDKRVSSRRTNRLRVPAGLMALPRAPHAAGLHASARERPEPLPGECGAGGVRSSPRMAAYGSKSAPNAPRIGPMLHVPMTPSGPSASWPTNIPSSSALVSKS